uniref:Potassium sodium hyperpolarization-activated cyclic nucleotide-gated channel protein n=1 Tax=Tetraselmis sp. GSL018 TaxID=582737 RepID=A0A061QTN1_9CHLO
MKDDAERTEDSCPNLTDLLSELQASRGDSACLRAEMISRFERLDRALRSLEAEAEREQTVLEAGCVLPGRVAPQAQPAPWWEGQGAPRGRRLEDHGGGAVQAALPQGGPVGEGEELEPLRPEAEHGRLRWIPMRRRGHHGARLSAKLRHALAPISPSSQFRLQWDLFILLLLVYICFAAPVVVCFDITIEYGVHDMWYWETFVTAMFALDIILNFNTAYTDADENLVTDRRKIAVHYLTGWFVIDIAAVLPYEAMTPNAEAEVGQLAKGLRLARFTRILRLLRVVKLIRVLKVPALLQRIEYVTGRGALRSATVVGAAVLITHLVACGFFYAAQLRMEELLGEELKNIGRDLNEIDYETRKELEINAWDGTWVGNAGLEDEGNASRYITALYWAMSTLTTVGYGDVTPLTNAEKIVSMFAMVVGVTIFAYFMGSTASLITTINSSETAVTQKISQMDDFLRQRRVPWSLQQKIRKFYSLAAQQQLTDDISIVNQLSTPLRTELLLFLYRNTLEKVPFFQGQDPQFVTSLVSKLQIEYYAEGDIVLKEGDHGNVMFFVVRGHLETRHYNFQDNNREEGEPSNTAPSHRVEPEPGGMFKSGVIMQKIAKSIKADKIARFRRKLDKVSEANSHIPKQWRFYSNVREIDMEFSTVGELREGEHFGEYSCLLGLPRATTVVATEFTELYSLSREDLMEVYRRWPELHKEFVELVNQIQEDIAASSNEHMQEWASSQLSILRPQAEIAATSVSGTGVQTSHMSTEEEEPSQPQRARAAGELPEEHSEIEAANANRPRKTSSLQNMQQTVKFLNTMKQFEKLSKNPVFQLLNSGQDLKGIASPDQSNGIHIAAGQRGEESEGSRWGISRGGSAPP